MDMMEDGEPPLLWSAEEPNLYVLVLSLLDDKGQLVEAESCQVRIPTTNNRLCFSMSCPASTKPHRHMSSASGECCRLLALSHGLSVLGSGIKGGQNVIRQEPLCATAHRAVPQGRR